MGKDVQEEIAVFHVLQFSAYGTSKAGWRPAMDQDPAGMTEIVSWIPEPIDLNDKKKCFCDIANTEVMRNMTKNRIK